jgi:hypothetical protein
LSLRGRLNNEAVGPIGRVTVFRRGNHVVDGGSRRPHTLPALDWATAWTGECRIPPASRRASAAGTRMMKRVVGFSRRSIYLGIAILATAALFPFQTASRTISASTPVWERIEFPPLAIPGTDHETMTVSVSQEVLVDTDKGPAYESVGTVGTTSPSFLRFDLQWSGREESFTKPRPRPMPIADEKNIHLFLHHGGSVQQAGLPQWIGVGNGGWTTWWLTAHVPLDGQRLDEAWFELQAAGFNYWVELPYGLGGMAEIPAVAEGARGAPQFPAEMPALRDDDVLVPWASVRYALDQGASLEMIDACDGRARVTLDSYHSAGATIDQLPIAVEIHRADGRVLKGREVERSIVPRESVFDFERAFIRDGAPRTWDAVWVDINGQRTTVVIPSSLFLLGHRLANFGDAHRIPVPGSNCKD